MLAAGDKVDRYVVEKLLGEGGMGSVYLARDTQLGRKIALKIMRADSRAGTEGSARILREARAAAALVHPNAVAVFDAREVDGVTYLAMEYLEGRSLREALAESVPVATRVRWLGDVARALAAAHACGLVHRDIKPENVMIKPDGTVKVLDFGIARQVSAIDPNAATAPSVSASTLSGTGLMVGTPLYMAPEQMRGDEVDGRADQFAWGVTAYEVLTGKLPWAHPTDGVKLIAEVVSASPVASLAGRAPVEVASVVDRALSKDPRGRFATMDDVVAALDGLVSSETRVLSPVATPRSGRKRWLVPVALVAAFAVAATSVFALRGNAVSPSPPGSATPAAASASVKLTELPPPDTRVPEAALQYKKGLQDLHDASIARGHAALSEATTRDPSLAAAWLREATWLGVPKNRARAAFLAAQQLRASLTERDRAVLHAYEPLHASDPADLSASHARLVALHERMPGDAEIALLAGWSASALGQSADAVRFLERALVIDPTFAAAEFALSGLRSGDEARAALARCVALAPTAASCLRALAFREAERGDCAAYESVAGRSLSVDPDGETAQIMMLGGLMSRGRSRAAMDALVERLRTTGHEPEMRGAVAAHFGDFVTATTALKSALDEAIKARDDRRRAFASVLLFQIADETGDESAMVPAARAYLGERTTWDPDVPELDGLSLGVMARGKGVTDVERASARTQLFESLAKKRGPVDPQVSFLVDATAARTPDEARRAVASLSGAKLDDFLEPVRSAAAGRALLLAARPDDAARHLEAAARNCAVLGQWSPAVVARVWARADLAEVRAGKGDVAAACAGLTEIATQWADAKPRSLTAAKATARLKTLACPR